MTTSNLIAIYYGWYDPNWKECVPADSGNVNACPPGSITPCPSPNDHTTMFPNRWAGRYLPNLKGTENPATELYSSIDETIIRTQLTLMKQAGIGGLAFSYWGSQKPITVTALDKLFQVLNSPTNPHTEIKISIYYEDQANRSLATVEADVQNILNKYGSSPYFHKINNKPVFWVYGNGTLSLAQKWNTVRTNKNIYVIQKEFGTAWKSNLNLADSWHQYSPANRYVLTQAGTTKYASGVSAGFWRYHACQRLLRCDTNNDYSPFENALIQMKNDGAQLHILFWNEWEENSGIEPATLFNHIEGGTNPFSQSGTPYGTKYLDLVAKYFGQPIPPQKKFNILNIRQNNSNIGVTILQNDTGTFTKDQACIESCTRLGLISPTGKFDIFNTKQNGSNNGVIVLQNDSGQFTKDQACTETCMRLGLI